MLIKTIEWFVKRAASLPAHNGGVEESVNKWWKLRRKKQGRDIWGFFFHHYRHHPDDWVCSGVHCDQTGSSGCSMRFIQKAFMSPPLPFMPSVISIIIIIVIIIISCGDDQTMIMILTIMLTPSHGCKQGAFMFEGNRGRGEGWWMGARSRLNFNLSEFCPPSWKFCPPGWQFCPRLNA